MGGETEEYREAEMDLEERKNELNRQIELSCGFEELRRKLEDFEEIKKWEANGEAEMLVCKMFNGNSTT